MISAPALAVANAAKDIAHKAIAGTVRSPAAQLLVSFEIAMTVSQPREALQILAALYNFFDGSRRRGGRMRAHVAAALITAAAVMLPATARAQPIDERSRCLAREGVSPDQKVDSCTAVIDSGRETPQGLVAVLNSRGNAHLNNRNFDRAIADYDEAIRRDPKFAIGFNNRGLAYLRKGDNDRAVADFDEAIRLDPKYAIGFNNRALAYQARGQSDRAIEDFDEAIRLNPRYAMAFVNRANVYRVKGRIDLAIGDGDQAIVLAPNLAAAFFARAAAYQEKAQLDFDAYLAEGKYEDRAIADYGEAIRLDPSSAASFRNRGVLNTKMQRYERAVADFDEAVRLDPNVAAAFYGRALALRYVGQHERAVADYRKALALKLDDPSRRADREALEATGGGQGARRHAGGHLKAVISQAAQMSRLGDHHGRSSPGR
jgi:tetratricopeptide (TPR) repeat protein